MNLHDRELENGGETKKLLQETKKPTREVIWLAEQKKVAKKWRKTSNF